MPKPKTLDLQTLEVVNKQRLEGCADHAFVEVRGKSPQQFKCRNCGGTVDGARQNYYTAVQNVFFRP